MKERKKIKVFLGAYINQTNAQNLNCLVLAKNLDKDKYKVYTLNILHGNMGIFQVDGVTIFQCRYPVKLTSYIGFLWGILNCDVAYLPRGNNYRYQRMLLKVFGKRSFKTVENILDDEALRSAVSVLGPIKNILENYSFCTRNFSITRFMKDYNLKRWNLKTEEDILPLITDTALFKSVRKERQVLKEVLFIGNDMTRKGVSDYIQLASGFPAYTFHVVGRNSTGIDLSALMQEFNVQNVKVHGMLSHASLLDLLKEVQLHILPSRSEGFPRGIIETAAAGIPTITYTGYGAEEWITNGINGYVTTTVESLKEVFGDIAGKNTIQTLSAGAIALAERFDAKIIVKKYEAVIDQVYEA